MVEGPDTDTAVFVRVLRDIEAGRVRVEGTDIGKGGPWRTGEIVVVRWSAVKTLVLGGELELI